MGILTKKTIVILIINIIVYSVLDIRYIPIIAVAILWSYFISICIRKENYTGKKWLTIGIVSIIFMLVFFKNSNFFLGNRKGNLQILMPLGISYYTFKILSYMIDTYRKKIDESVNLLEYAAYVSFFPQIICGPISRADEFVFWLKDSVEITEENFLRGGEQILSGMFKKFVIADRLSVYVTAIFNAPTSYPTIARWIAAFFFSIQLYCDFAGYSEIAIGVCNLLGFECRINFDKPYFSVNIREFWDRWHMSLSAWLRDYIYIPLGGSRRSGIRKKINIMITFIVSGFWHGNGLNFICWGIWHGILNMIPVGNTNNRICKSISMLGTFVAVMFGWIMFRASSLSEGIFFIRGMFQDFHLSVSIIINAIRPFTGDYSCLPYMITVCVFILILYVFEWRDYFGKVKNLERSFYIRSCFYFASIIFFGIIGQNSFLYANF